jgi:hypothetical protein
MEVITGAKAPEYLKGPYIQKEDTTNTLAKDTAIPIMKNGIGHRMQSTITKPYQGKEPEKTRNDHKRLEKGSENTESEKVKTSYVPILPQNYQTVQVWFGRKKRSPRGRKEAQDNSIKVEQSQETPMENMQVGLTEDVEGIEDIENIKGIEDLEGIEDIEVVENFEGIEDIDGIEVEGTKDIEEIEELEAMDCTETDEVHEIKAEKPEIELEEPKNGQMIICNAITIPREFIATSWVQREEDARGATPILLADDEECQDTGKIVFEKPTLFMCQHLKPLYIKAYMDGRPINRVLVNNGAAVNILPTSIQNKK